MIELLSARALNPKPSISCSGKLAMEAIGESSLGRLKSDDDDKPLIVRVKRKASHSPVDAFWLEINERPLKRPFLDFEKLSISELDASIEENELKIKRVLVKHVESTNSSEADFDFLQSFLPRSAEVSGSNTVMEERRRAFRKDIKEELLSKAREAKETIAKNARFEQIWSRRKGSEGGTNKALHDVYQFYDVVRVDGEEKTSTFQKEECLSLDDQRMLSSYLPILREFIPSAAAEIESDLKVHESKEGATDDYIYDYYTVNDNVDMWKDDSFSKFPLVQVDVDEFYDECDESDMESYDSNAENNPLNDYPEEESEEEIEIEDSDGQSEEEEEEEEEESAKNSSSESEDYVLRGSSDIDASFEDVMGFDDNVLDHDHEEGESEGADWRWSYR